jgi:hypothetical protein
VDSTSTAYEELSGATPDDQDFIAHARQEVPRLVQEIQRLRSLPKDPVRRGEAPIGLAAG